MTQNAVVCGVTYGGATQNAQRPINPCQIGSEDALF